MGSVRRFAVLLVIAAAVGLGPVNEVVAGPSGAPPQGCCCDPSSCDCPVPPPAERAAQSCGCGPSAPTPAPPQPAGPTLSGPGTELAAVVARMPVALAEQAPPHADRRGPQGGRSLSGPLIFLSECALLI
jgi:hypothetical protein